jgi:hypothetical protein
LPLGIDIKNVYSERQGDWSLDVPTIEKYDAYVSRYLSNKISSHFVSSSLPQYQNDSLYTRFNKMKDSFKKVNPKEYFIDIKNLNLNRSGYAICLLTDWKNKDRHYLGRLYPYFGYQGSLIPKACEIETFLFVFNISTGELVFYSSNLKAASKGMDTDLELMNSWNAFYKKVRGTINPLINSFIKQNECFSKYLPEEKFSFDLRGRLQN